MSFVRQHRVATAVSVVVAAVVGTLTAIALSQDGYQTRHVNLNDGGIWVTSPPDLGLWGRLNKPAGALDLALAPPGQAQSSYQLDIRQQGAAVAGWDVGGGALYPIDPSTGKRIENQSVPVSSQEQVEIDGGTVAVLDPRTGKVWAQRVDVEQGLTNLSGLDPSAKPIATLPKGGADGASGQGAGLAVAADGTVYAADARGDTVVVAPGKGERFAKPRKGSLGHQLDSVQVTVIGTDMIVYDATKGDVYLPGKRTTHVDPDANGQVQTPSDAGRDLMVATSRSLHSIPLSGDDKSETLYSGGTGRPAAPTWLGPCVHAAWAGPSPSQPGVYARACDGEAAKQIPLPNRKALVHPVFRVNRGSILLNDLTLGSVYDLSSLQEVDNWSAVKPPPLVRVSKKNKNNTTALAPRNLPPKANDDDLGARPGRTTVLHVLDNDSSPSQQILAVTRLGAPDDPAANVQIAPDGQSVEVSLPDRQTRNVHFKYTIDDGKGLTASASVTVRVRTPDENDAPHVRAKFVQRSFSVSAGGSLEIPVLDDWRDDDGDPLVVTGASASGGSVTVSPDGRLNYLAPSGGGSQKITYRVSDGRAAAQKRSIPVTVLAPDSAKTSPPVAQPDIARGQVGKPIRVKPLGNDLPGADPTNPNAELALAGNLASPAGAKVQTDLKSGEVTITASRHGTFVLNYTAAYGNARFGHSMIRVDVADAPASPQPPVAVPDTGVLYGQSAATIDVVANDFDPAGGVLVVQHAQPESDDNQLQVAILGGRFLRVSANQAILAPNTQVIDYTITDGLTAPVTGQLTLTQQPAPDPDTPLAVDDYATVRAGDSTLVPVLDNDIDRAGAPLSLYDDIKGAPAPGQLTVASADDTKLPDAGAAFVSGKQVRYVAPAVTKPTAATISYVAQNPDGNRATGTVHVTITPLPSKTNPNQAPTAQPVESRVISGDTIRIHLPTTGVDPDGDTANVVGITSAPKLGRIVAIGSTSITYEAFPTQSGTDRFGYTVSDAYGLTSSSTISVGVGQATDPQPPMAVDDAPTAAPGAKVRVDVLGNDVIAPDDSVAIEPLARSNPDLPRGTKLLHEGGPIEVTAPARDGENRVIRYAVNDGAGDPSSATITLHAQKGYVPPPVAQDVPATPAPQATTATVDVLAKATDPQGLPLHVARVYAPGVRVVGGKLVIPVLSRVRNIVVAIANTQGGTAAAVVHVPARGVGAPYGKANTLIQVPRNGSKTVAIADYVIDPPGRAVRLTTTDRLFTAPSDKLALTAPDTTHLKLSAKGNYDGPAAITFEVSDGKTLDDPKGQLALITVQVQVGDPTPVVRCPTAPVSVVEGGAIRRLDVTALCHVWLPDRSKLSALRYSATWQKDPGNVDLLGSGGHTIGVQAHGSAKPGAEGTISVGVPGTRAKSSTIDVVVRKLGPPSIQPLTIDGVKAGTTVTRNLRGYVSSPLADPQVTIVRVDAVTTGAKTAFSGSTLRITPGASTHGTMSFRVVASDIADTKRRDRQVVGQVTLHVLNVPDPPGNPQVGRTVLSQTVVLSWSTPPANGAQIDGYRVEWSGGAQSCPASPCKITGLTNGRSYTFRVRAHNAVGYSKPSVSSPAARPDKLPAAVAALTASDPQDHSLRISWRPVDNGSSAVRNYQVHWSGGGSKTVTGSTYSVLATGLDNHNRYTFTVVAVNQLGPGPATSVQGQSAGAPGTPANVQVAYVDGAGTTQRTVRVSWNGVDPNGAGSPTYTVTRNDGATVCANTTATDCTDNPASARTYTYSVQARNQAGHVSGKGTSPAFVVAGTPDTPTNVSAQPTNSDGAVQVNYTAPDSHGQQPRIECQSSAGGCASSYPSPAAGSGGSIPLSGQGNDNDVTVQVRSCNEQQCGAWSAPARTHTNGPPGQPSVSCSRSGQTLTWNWTRPGAINGHKVSFRLSDATSGTTDSTSWSHTYPEDGASHRLQVTSVDDRGETGGSGSATCTDAPKPDPKKLTVTMGGYTQGSAATGSCTSGCHYIRVQLQGFSPNTTYQVNLKDNPGDYNRTYSFTTNGSGDAGPTDSYGYYGGPHNAGYGTIDGTVVGTGVSDSCYGNWQKGTGCQ